MIFEINKSIHHQGRMQKFALILLQRQSNSPHPQKHTIYLGGLLKFSYQSFFAVSAHHSPFGVCEHVIRVKNDIVEDVLP